MSSRGGWNTIMNNAANLHANYPHSFSSSPVRSPSRGRSYLSPSRRSGRSPYRSLSRRSGSFSLSPVARSPSRSPTRSMSPLSRTLANTRQKMKELTLEKKAITLQKKAERAAAAAVKMEKKALREAVAMQKKADVMERKGAASQKKELAGNMKAFMNSLKAPNTERISLLRILANRPRYFSVSNTKPREANATARMVAAKAMYSGLSTAELRQLVNANGPRSRMLNSVVKMSGKGKRGLTTEQLYSLHNKKTDNALRKTFTAMLPKRQNRYFSY